MKQQLVVLFVFLSAILTVYAEPVAQWRGPQRDGYYPETGLLKQWPEAGPPMKWFAEGMGEGWGSPSITPETIFVVGTFDKQDCLVALDHAGIVKWKTAYGPHWKKSFPSARCTPTVESGRVYVSSGSGVVACIDADSGTVLWSDDYVSRFEGQQGPWGIAESLLVVDGKVIFTPGGDQTTMIALDKKSGEVVWKSQSINDKTAYVSPILVELDDRKITITVTAEYVMAVDSADGQILWNFHYYAIDPPEKIAPYINCISPIYHDGMLFVTSGYNHTAIMLKITSDWSRAEMVWKQPVFDTHLGGVVRVGDSLYGSNWDGNKMGRWVCAEWKTGQIRYETEWKNKGAIIYADGMLYCYEEKDGHIALVKPTPEGFEPVSSFQITKGDKQHWAHPVIADKMLYVRHGDVLMAFDIAAN